MMYDGWMGGHGWGWAGWTMVCIAMVVFWAAVITAVVVAIRYAGGWANGAGTQATYGPPRPQDVLADRFARGEIDEDEYRQRAALLHQHH
jgi:putative membrane protein